MAAPKVIALYRGRFALDEQGELQPSIKSTIVVGRAKDAPVAYLCGLLNSELLDLWYAVRGKTPWHVRRNYEPLRMNEMPYKPASGDSRSDEIAEFVRELAANRRALLPHRPLVRDLERTVKDPWRTRPVEIVESALLPELSTPETVSLRLDTALRVDIRESARARVVRAAPNALELRAGRNVVVRVSGDPERIDLLEHVLAGKADEHVLDTLLPKDVAVFRVRAEQRRASVEALLAEGRELVERIERLVCAVYDVPDDLTEQVVEHAVRRAG